MTAKNGEERKWCRITVAIRRDILAAAQSAGIDIPDLCNKALAGSAGILYKPEPEKRKEAPEPVIVAGADDSGGAQKHEPPTGGSMHPVINADDPKARAAVKGLPRQKPVPKPATLPGRISPMEKPPVQDPPAAVLAPALPPEKPRPSAALKSGKRQKTSPIRQFVTECIARDAGEECHISKESLYLAFIQWCRERRITPIPDRRSVTITLKNQFAMTEAPVSGEPSWQNARIR